MPAEDIRHPEKHPSSKPMLAPYHVGWTSLHQAQRTRPGLAFPVPPPLSSPAELSHIHTSHPPEPSAFGYSDGKFRNVRGEDEEPAWGEQTRFIPIIKSNLS